MNTLPASPKARAALAVKMIAKGDTSRRRFDDIFEQGDGDFVVCEIVHLCKRDDATSRLVSQWNGGKLPQSWVEAHARLQHPELALS